MKFNIVSHVIYGNDSQTVGRRNFTIVKWNKKYHSGKTEGNLETLAVKMYMCKFGTVIDNR